LTTNYTVTLAVIGTSNTYNGSVTLLSPYATLSSDYDIVIQRVLPMTQLISLSDNSSTPAQTYMEGYDRNTMLSQQLQEQVSRAVTIPANLSSAALPQPVAGYILGWSATGTLTNLVGTASGTLAVPIADANLQTISAAGKVGGGALTLLTDIPSGAGRIPRANTPLIYTDTVVTLTDGVGSVIDSTLGNIFSMTATADRTLGTTTGSVNGQKIIIEFTASGGARTLTLPNSTTGDFAFGSDITAITQTASGKTDYVGAIYHSSDARYHVVAYAKGYST
jgi:hypothetical protein